MVSHEIKTAFGPTYLAFVDSSIFTFHSKVKPGSLLQKSFGPRFTVLLVYLCPAIGYIDRSYFEPIFSEIVTKSILISDRKKEG